MAAPNWEVIAIGEGDVAPIEKLLSQILFRGLAEYSTTTTPGFWCSMEAVPTQGTLTAIPILQGPPGPTGDDAFALHFEPWDIPDPGHLPTDLGPTLADLGRYWIVKVYDSTGTILIGAHIYIWDGQVMRQMPIGSQGPPGPYPTIDPVLVQHDNVFDGVDSSYTATEDDAGNITATFTLQIPVGPRGPACPLYKFTDVDVHSQAPEPGQVLGWNGTKWANIDAGDIIPRPYVIPEAAFGDYFGINNTNHQVGSFTIPAQEWDWIPFFFGHMQINGLDIALNPMTIGCAVFWYKSDWSNGQNVMVARGFGNTSGMVMMTPRFGLPGQDPHGVAVVMNPHGADARIPAGQAATFAFNVVNEGLLTIFDYHHANSQVFCLCIPASNEMGS